MTNANFVTKYRTSIIDMLTARQALKTAAELGQATGLPASLQVSDFANEPDLGPEDLVAAMAAMGALESMLTDFGVTPPVPKPALTALLKFLR